jgi:hypothetical protein
MPTKKRSLTDSLSTRSAKMRRKAQSHRTLHWIGGRAAATLLVGASLSVGGVTEAFQGVHFLLLKDLDSVKVVRQQGSHAKVVANLGGDFAGNSLFKLSRTLPDSLVTQRVRLFDDAWLRRAPVSEMLKRSRRTFHREMQHQRFYPSSFRQRPVRRHHPRHVCSTTSIPQGRAAVETESRFGRMRVRWRRAVDAAHAEDRPLDGGGTLPMPNRTSTRRRPKYLNQSADGNLKDHRRVQRVP